MQVRSVMTQHPSAVGRGDSLASAAIAMWEGDFGVVPVVENGRVVGMLTDRDICMACALNGKKPADLQVEQAMQPVVFGCAPEAEVREALAIMRDHRVRRLPVLDAEGSLVGILSMNDVALAAKSQAGLDRAPTYAGMAEALQAICAHRRGLPSVTPDGRSSRATSLRPAPVHQRARADGPRARQTSA